MMSQICSSNGLEFTCKSQGDLKFALMGQST